MYTISNKSWTICVQCKGLNNNVIKVKKHLFNFNFPTHFSLNLFGKISNAFFLY